MQIRAFFINTARHFLLLFLASGGWLSQAAVASENLCVQLAGTSETQPQPMAVPGAKSYVYKSIQGIDLHLHVFQPASTMGGPAPPAIVFFFGGAWMVGSINDVLAPAQYVASRGATAVVVEYRVYCRSRAGIKDEMADAASSIRWIRGHAKTLSIDPDRIAASGGSSGGHLALSTAMFSVWDEPAGDRAISSKPNLLVLFYPCVDETTEEELSYAADAIGTHGKEVSPLYHIVSGLPPTILFQGTADSLFAENKRYCDEARTKGNRCDFIEVAEAPHNFFYPSAKNDKWYRSALKDADRYLTDAGYLVPLPPLPSANQRLTGKNR